MSDFKKAIIVFGGTLAAGALLLLLLWTGPVLALDYPDFDDAPSMQTEIGGADVGPSKRWCNGKCPVLPPFPMVDTSGLPRVVAQ